MKELSTEPPPDEASPGCGVPVASLGGGAVPVSSPVPVLGDIPVVSPTGSVNTTVGPQAPKQRSAALPNNQPFVAETIGI